MGQAAGRILRGLMVALITLLVAAATVQAQETGQIGQLYISDADTESFPAVRLRLYGRDGAGQPIDFATTPLFITHDGIPVDEVIFENTEPAGTLTVFLIDAAGGTGDQIPAIQEAIQQFASAGNMQEQIDRVAVYQVRSGGPQQLLAPAQFYNDVTNLFTTSQLSAEEGSTSLYDSVITLIGEVEAMSEESHRAASIVLIGDGTDPGTSQAQPADVSARAMAAGIPIHTIHLENPALGIGLELGRTYLRDLASATRGAAAELANAEELAAIWTRIASYRDHAWVHYNVPEAAGGTVPVEVALFDNRDVRAATEVTISSVAPNVVLDVPRESRSLTVRDLDEPVALRLSAAVSWLDGEVRQVSAAELRVNGQKVMDIPVADLASFNAAIPNFFFGDNRLEVVATDSQGITSSSAPITISVAQGDQLEVPEALQPARSGFRWTWLLWLLALGALAAGLYWWWRNRGTPAAVSDGSSSRRRRRRGASPPVSADPIDPDIGLGISDEPALARPEGYEAPFVMAHLEVLETQSVVPQELTLGDTEVRIGRSPAQSHFAFRDDITVSRYHAVMRLEGSRYRIYDAGSTSGTYINGRQVPEYGLQLSDGDEIQLGAVRLRYRQL